MKLFNKDSKEETSVTVVKSPTVEMVHNHFYTEVDRLLEEAKVLHSTEANKSLLEKGEKLRQLGFINSTETRLSQVEEQRVRKLQGENMKKENMVKAIEYFGTKYPQYKFITEQSVKDICKKYSLIYGTVNHYIGNVPERDLERMLQFKVDVKDRLYVRVVSYTFGQNKDVIDYETYKKSIEREANRGIADPRTAISYTVEYEEHLLEICAPASDFNVNGMEVEDFNLKEKPKVADPVVLHPVFFQGTKYYLIVTAWGDEASDEKVVNERMQ